MVRSVNREHGCCRGVASFYGVRCGGSCALHRFARRFKRRWRAEVVAVLVLLLRFPWLLREEEELAVAQGAEMVVAGNGGGYRGG